MMRSCAPIARSSALAFGALRGHAPAAPQAEALCEAVASVAQRFALAQAHAACNSASCAIALLDDALAVRDEFLQVPHMRGLASRASRIALVQQCVLAHDFAGLRIAMRRELAVRSGP